MNEHLMTNPWLKIWTSPKKTIRAIVNYNPNYLLMLLCGIYAFPGFLHAAQFSHLGDDLPLSLILSTALVLSPLFGFIFVSVFAFFLYFSGRLIAGESTYKGIRSAVLWSNVPNIGSLAIWSIFIGAFGSSLFESDTTILLLSAPYTFVFLTALSLQIVFSIWSFVILLNTLSEVQKFSKWLAFYNLILASLFSAFVTGALLSISYIL